ncbi:MAG TPA: alpha/beta hydrolase [Candidatus Hydrogenedentes bacterium]|nr:alpha/beta hydrolase [Candidatus Hydrogenedentota bacterium]
MFERLAEVSFEKIAHVTATESNVKAMIELQRPALASAEYIEIEGASHFIPQERPKEVADILRATFA